MNALVLTTMMMLAADEVPSGTAPPVVEPLDDADGVHGLRAQFVVEAPAARVLELLWDVRRFREVFPDIHELIVVARPGPDVIDVKFVVDAVVAKPDYTLRRRVTRAADGGGVVSWTSIAGDLRAVRGSWRVEAVGDARARVTYTSFVDPGGPLFLTSSVRDVALGKVTTMAARVRDAAKAGSAPAELHGPAAR